jgi:hypothetical protein
MSRQQSIGTTIGTVQHSYNTPQHYEHTPFEMSRKMYVKVIIVCLDWTRYDRYCQRDRYNTLADRYNIRVHRYEPFRMSRKMYVADADNNAWQRSITNHSRYHVRSIDMTVIVETIWHFESFCKHTILHFLEKERYSGTESVLRGTIFTRVLNIVVILNICFQIL